jgi:microcystin-dependent protein
MFIGQLIIYAGTVAPPGTMACDGQVLPIIGNESLAATIGTTFGGDGINTIALPDLRGRTPIHGRPGFVQVGQFYGFEQVMLITSDLPQHSHAVPTNAAQTVSDPTGHIIAGNLAMFSVPSVRGHVLPGGLTPNVSLNPSAIQSDGLGLPHANIQPYLALNFCICVSGGQVPVAGNSLGGAFTAFGGMVIWVAFSGNVPTGWMSCDDPLLLRSAFNGLFSLIGTLFDAGDGSTNFGLPNLPGMAINGAGTGPGLSAYAVGDFNGEASHPLIDSELPIHTHVMQATTAAASLSDPTGALLAGAAAYNSVSDGSSLYSLAISSVGQSTPHENRQPFLALTAWMATDDVDPVYVIGEIRMIPTGTIPANWAACDGTLVNVAAEPNLYAVIGIAYGGTLGVNFRLPDLRGRIPVHVGTGPATPLPGQLSSYSLGQAGGTETVTLDENSMPSHTHTLNAASGRGMVGQVTVPNGHLLCLLASGDAYGPAASQVSMGSGAVGSTGSGAAHNNLMQEVALQYIIALSL